jgi:hypothetical protein
MEIRDETIRQMVSSKKIGPVTRQVGRSIRNHIRMKGTNESGGLNEGGFSHLSKR